MAEKRETLYKSATLRFELHTFRGLDGDLIACLSEHEVIFTQDGAVKLESVKIPGGIHTFARQRHGRATKANIEKLHALAKEQALKWIPARLSELIAKAGENLA